MQREQFQIHVQGHDRKHWRDHFVCCQPNRSASGSCRRHRLPLWLRQRQLRGLCLAIGDRQSFHAATRRRQPEPCTGRRRQDAGVPSATSHRSRDFLAWSRRPLTLDKSPQTQDGRPSGDADGPAISKAATTKPSLEKLRQALRDQSLGGIAVTPRSIKAAIRSFEYPISRSTSTLCSPNLGTCRVPPGCESDQVLG